MGQIETPRKKWFGKNSDYLLDCPRKAEATLEVQLRHRTKWRSDNTCSYCGSLKPSVFFKALDDGAEYGATDKGYKAYLSGEKAPKVRGACKVYFQHFDRDDYDNFIRRLNDGSIQVYTLPYFVRVSEPKEGN